MQLVNQIEAAMCQLRRHLQLEAFLFRCYRVARLNAKGLLPPDFGIQLVVAWTNTFLTNPPHEYADKSMYLNEDGRCRVHYNKCIFNSTRVGKRLLRTNALLRHGVFEANRRSWEYFHFKRHLQPANRRPN